MTKHRNTAFDPDDLIAAVAEIEGFEAEKLTIQDKANADKKIVGNKIDTAKDHAAENGIPKALLTKLLKRRAFAKKAGELSANISEEYAEVWQEMIDTAGGFEETPLGGGPLDEEPRDNSNGSPVNEAAEQAEGAALLGKPH